MGVIRLGVVILLGILLFFSLFAANALFVLSSSLKYDNVKEELDPLLHNLSEGTLNIGGEPLLDFNLTEAASDIFNESIDFCLNSTEYNFNYSDYTINIPCETANLGVEAVIDETFNDLLEQIYYYEYDCNFWNCFSTNELPFFLISKKAHDYWKSKFYFSLLISLILVVLMFLFTKRKINTLIILGALLVASVLPFLKLESFLYTLMGNSADFLVIFLSSAKSIFWFSLILGLLLVAFGIFFRFWPISHLKELFRKSGTKKPVKK